MAEGRVVSLQLGCFAKPIGEQLDEQGFVPDNPDLPDLWQRQSEAISLLSIGGLITDASCHAARTKLVKSIGRQVIAKELTDASTT